MIGQERENAEALGYDFTVGDLLRTVRRRFWILALVTAVFVGGAVAFSLLQTPVYEASIKILVGQEQQSEASNSLQSSVQGLQQLTQTMEEAVNSGPIATSVIQRLDLGVTAQDFLSNMSAEQIGATQFIEVKYQNPDPEEAQDIANAVGSVFSEQVSEISPNSDAITATVWERATMPESPVSPNLLLNVLLGLVLGLMLGLASAFLVEYLDDSWSSAEELEQVSGVPSFGVIPQFKLKSPAPKTKKGNG